MLNIIKERERVESTEYCLDFYKDGELCAGYDTKDKLTPIFHSKEGEENWHSLLQKVGLGILTGPKLNEYKSSYVNPAIGKCSCGNEFELVDQYAGACECEKCHQWYNLFGQELLPPDKWDMDDYEEPW